MNYPGPVDPARADLLEAFCRAPFGPFTPDVESFARWVYFQPGPTRYVLKTLERHREWQLARYRGERDRCLEDFPQVRFSTLADGAAEIARRRWREEILGLPVDTAEFTSQRSLATHLIGYCEPWSVAPGERLEVKVSARGAPAYHVEPLRVICGDDSPQGPGLDLRPAALLAPRHRLAREHCNPTGSFIKVEKLAPCASGLTVQCFASPWLPRHGVQTLMAGGSPQQFPRWALKINPEGQMSFCIVGENVEITLTLPGPLVARAWYLVAALYDPDTGLVELQCQALASTQAGEPALASVTALVGERLLFPSMPLWMGAGAGSSAGGRIEHAFNGRLERPRLAPRWLQEEELKQAARHNPTGELLAEFAGAWNFIGHGGDIGVEDRSGHGNHGVTVNLPTRCVAGADWNGSAQDPRLAPEHYAAIHFHEDDLYDAGWPTDFVVDIPSDTPSGLYVLKLKTHSHTSYINFVVRPPRDRPLAPLALLVSTATSMAYGNYRFQLELGISGSQLSFPIVLEPDQVLLQENSHLGLSQYDRHVDGSGVHHASRRRPLINHGVCTDVWNLNADTHLLAWLDQIGQSVDLITDEDLHRDGYALLSRYRCVMTGSHPEYWSSDMWRAMRDYRNRNGRLMYLGGNGFYWRIAWHPTLPGVTEVRRPASAARYWASQPGESFLDFTGEHGGLWRNYGEPPEGLVGVGTRAICFERSVPYRRTAASYDPRVDFMFRGLDPGAPIGSEGFVGGGAAGSEIDAASEWRGTPSHALIVATADALPPSAQPVPEDVLMCHPAQGRGHDPDLRADMVFFETPGGGAVFSVGSVAFIGALPWNAGDNAVSRLTRNVLARFLDATVFSMPERK